MKSNKRFNRWCGLVILPLLMESGPLLAAETLGEFPLCEASAALVIPCPDNSDSKCLLVADNEQGSSLFLFTVGADKLGPMQIIDLTLKGKDQIEDIEALSIAGNTILAFASHSRKSTCEFKKKRQRFGMIDLAAHKTAVVAPEKPEPPTCGNLLVRDTSMQAVCDAIDTANTDAAAIEANLNAVAKDAKKEAKKIAETVAEKACYAVDSYSAEGAVTLAAGNKNDTWIGLRAPLLNVHPDQPGKKNLAILLHLKDLTAYTFDSVAFLDLEGRAIRDLHANGDFIWIIAGPEHDDPATSFQLRRIANSALAQNKVIDTELVIDNLPNSSEGLAISGKKAYVVTDGDDGEPACKNPAKYTVLSLP